MNFQRSAAPRLPMSEYLLDASAVLALLNQETGHDKVEAILADSVISTIIFVK